MHSPLFDLNWDFQVGAAELKSKVKITPNSYYSGKNWLKI